MSRRGGNGETYVEPIDVCHTVLAQYPNYPGIKKDVLEKACVACLRLERVNVMSDVWAFGVCVWPGGR